MLNRDLGRRAFIIVARILSPAVETGALMADLRPQASVIPDQMVPYVAHPNVNAAATPHQSRILFLAGWHPLSVKFLFLTDYYTLPSRRGASVIYRPAVEICRSR